MRRTSNSWRPLACWLAMAGLAYAQAAGAPVTLSNPDCTLSFAQDGAQLALLELTDAAATLPLQPLRFDGTGPQWELVLAEQPDAQAPGVDRIGLQFDPLVDTFTSAPLSLPGAAQAIELRWSGTRSALGVQVFYEVVQEWSIGASGRFVECASRATIVDLDSGVGPVRVARLLSPLTRVRPLEAHLGGAHRDRLLYNTYLVGSALVANPHERLWPRSLLERNGSNVCPPAAPASALDDPESFLFGDSGHLPLIALIGDESRSFGYWLDLDLGRIAHPWRVQPTGYVQPLDGPVPAAATLDVAPIGALPDYTDPLGTAHVGLRLGLARGDWWDAARVCRDAVAAEPWYRHDFLGPGAGPQAVPELVAMGIFTPSIAADAQDEIADAVFDVRRLIGDRVWAEQYRGQFPDYFNGYYLAGSLPGRPSWPAAIRESRQHSDGITTLYINASAGVNAAKHCAPIVQVSPPTPDSIAIAASALRFDGGELAEGFAIKQGDGPCGANTDEFRRWEGQTILKQCWGSAAWAGQALGPGAFAPGIFQLGIRGVIERTTANGVRLDAFIPVHCWSEDHDHPPGTGGTWLEDATAAALEDVTAHAYGTSGEPIAANMEGSLLRSSEFLSAMYLKWPLSAFTDPVPDLGYLCGASPLPARWQIDALGRPLPPGPLQGYDTMADLVLNSVSVPYLRVVQPNVKYSRLPDTGLTGASRVGWLLGVEVLSMGQLIGLRTDILGPGNNYTDRRVGRLGLFHLQRELGRLLHGPFGEYHAGDLLRFPENPTITYFDGSGDVAPDPDVLGFGPGGFRVASPTGGEPGLTPPFWQQYLACGAYRRRGGDELALVALNPWSSADDEQLVLRLELEFDPADYPEFASAGTEYRVTRFDSLTGESPVGSFPMSAPLTLTQPEILPGAHVWWTLEPLP